MGYFCKMEKWPSKMQTEEKCVPLLQLTDGKNKQGDIWAGLEDKGFTVMHP